MQIFVKGPSSSLTLNVGSPDSGDVLRTLVQAQDGCGAERLCLTYGGRPLEDGRALEEYGITDLATVNASVPLLGGKVHGSVGSCRQSPGADAEGCEARKEEEAHWAC
eukprot:EC123422.1.p2 GENE.EC123422.1~~EC123422.1.p2  ORF type:complete len:108 (+),score=13.12 EC123422.1:81-404(+)